MSTPDIAIFVRHTPGCKFAGDEYTRKCDCRKHFRWSQDGKQFRKSAGTRTWAEAEENKLALADQLSGKAPAVQAQTIRTALESFIKAKTVQGLEPSTVERYDLEAGRFVQFCEGRGVFNFARVDLDLLTEYQHTWPALYPSSYTRHYVQKRLTVFLRYCMNAGWLAKVPKMASIKISEPVTMPLTEKEYARVLAAVPEVFPNGVGQRIKAVIQLMRWTGLAVRDAATLKRSAIERSNGLFLVVTSRQKTGVHVAVPIPPKVAADILASALPGEYMFWDRVDGTETNAGHHKSIEISRVFAHAKVRSEGHMISHRLRDTFAVDLLQKGVPLEEVSKLLGHESVKTTEKHYAKWIKGRQDRLNNLVAEAWEK